MRATQFFAAGLVAVAALSLNGAALAQAVEMGAKPSVQDVTDALAPKAGAVKGARTRAIVFGSTQQPVHEPPPTARFRVEFELNSAELTLGAKQTLAVLGQALAGDQLSQFRFKIAGHTDARGSDDTNASLSARRAESVRRFLSDNFGIAPMRLVPEGYGASQPLDPQNPFDGRNRRVEIINIGSN